MMIQENLVDEVDTAIYTAAVEAFDAYTGTFPPEVGSVVCKMSPWLLKEAP